jgi:hypothetical protein
MTSGKRVVAAIERKSADRIPIDRPVRIGDSSRFWVYVDADIPTLNPVQLGTKDMGPAKLKRESGKDVTFGGY